MSWARIMAPLAGGRQDAEVLAAAVALADPFGAEVSGVYTPADVADVMPWIGESFLGGVETTALESLKQAVAVGEGQARAALEACPYANRRFVALPSPVWGNLCAEGRLSDVAVFDGDSARGRGPLAQSFQQLLGGEQRPVLVARPNLKTDGTIVIAWDGGKEASRAARLSMPLLEKAARVVIVTAHRPGARHADPARLQAYCAQRGVRSEIEALEGEGDTGKRLLEAARTSAADILVAGVFGHTRLQEFIFGSTTRTLLNSDGPSLFLSH